jgi:uncharacterized membrane protein YciS (DUF1049 family)
MMSITKRILHIILMIIIAGLIYIRIPKSMRNAEMQIKNLDLLHTTIFMISINTLEYTA